MGGSSFPRSPLNAKHLPARQKQREEEEGEWEEATEEEGRQQDAGRVIHLISTLGPGCPASVRSADERPTKRRKKQENIGSTFHQPFKYKQECPSGAHDHSRFRDMLIWFCGGHSGRSAVSKWEACVVLRRKEEAPRRTKCCWKKCALVKSSGAAGQSVSASSCTLTACSLWWWMLNAHLPRQTSAVEHWENAFKKWADDTCQDSAYMYDNAITILVVFFVFFMGYIIMRGLSVKKSKASSVFSRCRTCTSKKKKKIPDKGCFHSEQLP